MGLPSAVSFASQAPSMAPSMSMAMSRRPSTWSLVSADTGFRDGEASPLAQWRPLNAAAGTNVMENATLGQWRRDITRFRTQDLNDLNFNLGDIFNEEGDEDDVVIDGAKSESGSSSSSGSSKLNGESPNEMSTLKGRINTATRLHPEVYSWIRMRMGTRTRAFLVISFIALEMLRSGLQARAYNSATNLFSIIVVTNAASLIIALWITLIFEGGEFFRHATRWQNTVTFFGISFLFTFASVMVVVAYRIGTPSVEVVTVGYIYMPISAGLSYYVFGRKYGTLEWLSVGMMSLAVLAFVMLREECKTEVDAVTFEARGFGLVVIAVVISVAASILAERAFKAQDWCGRWRRGSEVKFYAMKVHLDFASLVISVCLWVARRVLPHAYEDFFVQWSHSKDWFGTWDVVQFQIVFVGVAQGWAAGLMTKEFSTVVKAIVQTMSVVLALTWEDKFMGGRFHFAARMTPSVILLVIVWMSGLIFQTGRINLQVLRRAAKIDTKAHPELGLRELAEPEGGPRRRASSKDAQWKAVSTEEAIAMTKKSHAKALPIDWKTLCTTYALILVYIVSDAGRTIVLQKSLQSAAINSISMGLVCYLCGMVVASFLSLCSHGFHDGLLKAWSPYKILRCLPAAFLFALATALGNMSFAMGINSALYVVLGKFYTPVAALGARWVMGKYYMWLEWFALLILTLASAAFGYLQAFDVVSGEASAGAPLLAMMLVLGSAATSALASLATEKILKDEQDVPFHMQKVRLDVGSIMSSLVLLPVLGAIATRAQDIPWALRPYDAQQCPRDSVCWDLRSGGCSAAACDCDCTSGIFAGWNRWVLVLAVFINTIQGWLVGKVTQQFSVIHRAIADSFSLLVIYFIGDPIFNGTSLNNAPLNLVAFIVPVSTATFSQATSEMQKVLQARETLRGSRRAPSVVADSEHSDEGSSDHSSDSSILSYGAEMQKHYSTDSMRSSSPPRSSSPKSVLSPGSPASPRALSPLAAAGLGAQLQVTGSGMVTVLSRQSDAPALHRTASEGYWM